METVSKITGTPVKDLQTVYEMYSSTGGPDKAGTIMYALGQTQHTSGVQNIRTMCMIQLLARQYGHLRRWRERPARGTERSGLNRSGDTLPYPARLSCSTPGVAADPGRLPQEKYPKTSDPRSANWWQNYPKYVISLLKAWYGDKATKENDFGYSWVPKLDDGQDCSILNMIDSHVRKKDQGTYCHRPESCLQPAQCQTSPRRH